MNILLLTFTGTGNTELCGNFLSHHFTEKGHTVTHYVFDADKHFNEDISKYDLIGIGYPIHAFNIPEVFYKWMKKLPDVEDKPYFIYKVSGEPFALNNSSSYHFVKLLKKKGYKKIAEKHFLMPYNIIFRYRDEIAKQMYLYLNPLTKLYVEELLAKDYEIIPYRLGTRILSLLLRIEWIAPKVNAPLSRMNKNCTKCNLCLNICPNNAIYINKKGKMRIKSSKCTMCMRCTYNCPTNAIRFGIINPWKVNGSYKYLHLVKNKDIAPEFINHQTKGYFKKFNKYFDKQKALLDKYHIANPIEDYLANQ